MKKLFVILIVSFTAFNTIQAQGYRRAGTNTQAKTMYKDELKHNLKISERQAMNIDAIQQDYMLKMRAITISTTITEEERKEQLATLRAERNEKLKTLITEKQIAKMEEVYARPNSKIYPPGEATTGKTEE